MEQYLLIVILHNILELDKLTQQILLKLKKSKDTYDLIGNALENAIDNGFGLSVPEVEQMELEKPEKKQKEWIWCRQDIKQKQTL